MSEKQLWICCFSDKEEVSISFGASIDSYDLANGNLDTDSIIESLSDSYWENCDEFENGKDKAKLLQKEDGILTYKDALYKVFGDFSMSFEVDGEEVNLSVDIDINDCIYALLAE